MMCGRATDRLRWKKPGDLRRVIEVREQPASDRSRVGLGLFLSCKLLRVARMRVKKENWIGRKGKKWKEGEAQNGR